MKKIFLGVVIGLAIALLAWYLLNSVGTPVSSAVYELQKHSINTTGPEITSTLTLPSQLSGPNWGMKQAICQQGGYDLSSYAGKTVQLTQYPTDAIYRQVTRGQTSTEPLNVWIISGGEKVLCLFLTVRQGSMLIPGIFSVNDPAIQR